QGSAAKSRRKVFEEDLCVKIGVSQFILKNYSLDRVIELCQTAGYDIVELVFNEGGDPDTCLGPDELRQLSLRLQEAGIEVTSVIADYKEKGNLLSPEVAQQEAKMKA